MAEEKRKIQYLTYIEETPKHFGKLEEEATKATRQAIRRAKSANLYITYQEDGEIIREHNDGRKEVIGTIEEPSVRVNIGDKTQL